MPASEAFELHPPTQDDLAAATSAWHEGTLCYEVAAGRVFWRTLRAPTPDDALQYARVCFPSVAESRYSPVIIAGNVVPSAYAACTRTTALWELPLRDIRHKGIKRVPTKNTRDLYLVKTRVTRDLELLDLRRPAISNLVSAGRRPPDLTAAGEDAYDATRTWAQALYSHLPEIDGFIYESHQMPGDCIFLLQPDDVDIFNTIGEALPLYQQPMRSLLRREARRAGAVVDFGDLQDDE